MSDKPLPPTAKRLRDARAEGNVARSEVFAGLAVAAITAEVAFACVDTGVERWLAIQHAALDGVASAERIGACLHLIAQSVGLIAAAVGLVAAAAFSASVLAAWATGGLAMSAKALRPSLKRLNAVQHLKGLFGTKHLTSIALAIASALIVGAVGVWQLRSRSPIVGAMIEWRSLAFDFDVSIAALHTLVRCLLLALLAPAVLSMVIVKVRYRIDLGMSHREIKDEIKQTSGDPAMRAHQRASLGETMAVPPVRAAGGKKALVTNPEHVSVLLHYTGDESEAPTVIGKALDRDALQMTTDALMERVPVFRFRRLARHLYHHAAIHTQIPAECYRAVAIVYRIVEQMEALDDRPNVPIDIDDIAFD